ncbi:miniconductance mechanosensitive channel [Hephaestia caeni]|uniref:Mechanosensing system component YbdG n=1 Tax=Hephaestia caeni TaxID=645617 RepID=A0A397NPF1_9SPHN|nr:mechanosensitive ion channel domain-containing protein [Hephaestia caeni]RIA36625.1 miniconductance mechanosensitive channel [Hephaestia caeni]
MREAIITDYIPTTFDFAPILESALWLCGLFVVAAIGSWIARQIVLRAIARLLDRLTIDDAMPSIPKVVGRLARAVPALIVGGGIHVVPHLPAEARAVVSAIAGAFVVVAITRAFSAVLDCVNEVYLRRPDAAQRPIKGYLQVVKIIVWCAAAVLIISILIGQSVLLLLSGLGAMAAVLMLVFKDTILSLVASVQLTSNDMVRVGDWIEMPQYNADGDVIDIALHTIKVQNWDKTITTVPTHKLIAESFRNWRGMHESGGRRIKRSLMIDQNSVRFLSADEIAEARRFTLLHAYLDERGREIEHWNTGRDAPNRRQMTNIGVFRAYVAAYLAAHPGINQEMTQMVRQLAPGPAGLPLELYCFTASTAWRDYEAVQADIFDHLLAVMRSFGLRLFQQPSGQDLAAALQRDSA